MQLQTCCTYISVYTQYLQYTLLEKKYNTKDDCADEKKILKNKIKISGCRRRQLFPG